MKNINTEVGFIPIFEILVQCYSKIRQKSKGKTLNGNYDNFLLH